MRTLITLLLIFYSFLAYSQKGWRKFEIGNVDDVFLYLKVKEYACAADDKWIAFEFENKSKDTIITDRWFSYSIERNAYGWSVNLAQEANFYPFGKTNGFSNFIPQGIHEVSRGISEEGSCMLGIPPIDSDTTEVFCTLSFSLPLSDGKKLEINNYNFSFYWHYPSDEQFNHLKMRLMEYLFLDKINYYYYSMLMDNREITDTISVKTYLKALTETKKDFNFRGDILQYLDKVHYQDTTVINYFKQNLIFNSPCTNPLIIQLIFYFFMETLFLF